MASFNRLINGLCAFALVLAFGMTSVTPAGAATDMERYDAMNLAPMPDELADGLRGGRFFHLVLLCTMAPGTAFRCRSRQRTTLRIAGSLVL